jgi:hypothetical protein
VHDEVTCWLHYPIWLVSADTPKSQRQTKPKRWHGFEDKIRKQTFDNMKATIAKDVTLAYPDYMHGFDVYTNGSKLQLGAIITQANRPLVFFS